MTNIADNKKKHNQTDVRQIVKFKQFLEKIHLKIAIFYKEKIVEKHLKTL